MNAIAFGDILRQRRIDAGIGLRRFADLVNVQPSNLSAVEQGRRRPPTDLEQLREWADALGLMEGSDEWAAFFDAAKRPGELPADIRHLADRPLVPVLLRTIANRNLDKGEIADLIAMIKSPHGGTSDDDDSCPADVHR